MKGVYALLIDLPEPREISVGRLGLVVFPRGVYAYIGSALKGIEARVDRHLRKNKKLHWHIDYLLQQAPVQRVVLCETEERLECVLAQYLSQEFPSIPGFGSSDCRCDSHLFFDPGSTRLEEGIIDALKIIVPGCRDSGLPCFVRRGVTEATWAGRS
ncbi:MAG: hypothetical protein A2Y91_04470 [Chloroflexi bacterium RBG_13_54_8]|nr:MAG: hypothetical protein A2Y91_04470 [Chloroflexi bacterium RBG_13_54_8]